MKEAMINNTKADRANQPDSVFVVFENMETVQGTELDDLLMFFASSVEDVAYDQKKYREMCGLIKSLNSDYVHTHYSDNPKAQVMSQVVSGIYAPLIHGFSLAIIRNIQRGVLPPHIISPPRDTIPILCSLVPMAMEEGEGVVVSTPPITRRVAGISNAQGEMCVKKDPLFKDLVAQTIQNDLCGTQTVCEVETGIYSTTTQQIAVDAKKHGVHEYIPLKLYGLGPNLSYIHGLLSGGGEWLAEAAEKKHLVDLYQISQGMVLLDSLEEIGMQNMYASVNRLKKDTSGRIVPVIVPVDEEVSSIAKALNQVITHTVKQYHSDDVFEKSINILDNMSVIVSAAKEGIPLSLSAAIPPMTGKNELFDTIRKSNIFTYPRLEL